MRFHMDDLEVRRNCAERDSVLTEWETVRVPNGYDIV